MIISKYKLKNYELPITILFKISKKGLIYLINSSNSINIKIKLSVLHITSKQQTKLLFRIPECH